MTGKISKTRHNIGEEGIDSIRVGGMPINNLPMVPLAHAKVQMADVRKTQHQNKVNNVKAKYPSQKVSYLDSRIVECRENITRIQNMYSENNEKIMEYTSLIMACKLRDAEITALPESPDKKQIVKEKFLKVPPYKTEAMHQQIKQFQEAMERCTEVIAQEYDSIAEFNEVLGLCKQRDLELRNLGE